MADITPKELFQIIQEGHPFPFYDVREAWEYEENNIGAKLLPLASIPERMADLEPFKNLEIIVHCKSGTRSNQARKYLARHGFEQVRCLEGGIEAYIDYTNTL